MKEVVVIAGGGASAAASACKDHLWRIGYEVFVAPGVSDPELRSSDDSRASENPDVDSDETLNGSVECEEEARQRLADREAEFLIDVVNRGRGLHVLINFSKRVLSGAAEDTAEREMRRCFENDYFALVQRVKAVMPAMRLRGAGAIINVCESAGVGVGAFFSHHRAAQAAIRAFSSSLCEEVRPFGIEVSFIEARSAVSGPALTQSRKARLSRLYWNRYKRALKEAEQDARSAPRALAMQIERIIARASVAKRLDRKLSEKHSVDQSPSVPESHLPESQSPRGSQSSGPVVKQMFPSRSRSQRRAANMPPVEFQGDWDSADRKLVESAISERETLRLLQNPRSGKSARAWHCTAEHLPNGRQAYSANRLGLGCVLTAGTADKLARQISSTHPSPASDW